ncbi:sodium/glucose cotransporter 5 isoform X2 [Lingula anatina]|uniref:Sodium/glucose cotransporter 5 isoform X2 n=1 Tax=Lingula anatina TaxID=7574 RepID=A0A1S3I0V3_LINAN|nr:sodium/glucose cotransporter 5 isoform X2 [Lingula anatina]|eukprot:XP_013391892.1 sodium/glucose cotransporter 5 isoform X2 [Lingula anatina]
MAQREAGFDHWADYVTLAIYFLVVFSVGIWSIFRSKRNTVFDFFLAGRSLPWWPIGLSIFASNIGSEHFIGQAGTAAVTGVAVVVFEWNAIPCLLALGWIFLPVYIATGVYTMPEYLNRRYGGQRLRIYLTAVTLIIFIFNHISVDLYSGAIFIQQAIGWSIYTSTFILLGVVAVYVLLGGLTTVIFTDAVQVIVMLLGGIVVCIMGFDRIGGWNQLLVKYMNAIPASANASNNTAHCGYPPDDAFHIFRDAGGQSYPWPGLFLRTSIAGSMWFWCASQLIVQRALAARSVTHAKGATLLAGVLKISPMFLMVIPGMISRILFPDEVACATPEKCMEVCENPAGCSNIAYPKLVLEVLPPGLRGLLLSVMMAAVVSTLTSVFNSASTIFTLDIWRRFRKSATNVEMLIVGRVFVVFLFVIAVLWMPVMSSSQGGQLYQYSASFIGYFQSPACAIYLLSVLWSRTTEPGAFYGMLLGQVVGVVRFVLDFVYPAPGCGEVDTRPVIVTGIHYLYFAVMQAGIAAVSAILISLLTTPPTAAQLKDATYWSARKHLSVGYSYEADKKDEAENMELTAMNGQHYGTDTESEDTPGEGLNSKETIVAKTESKWKHYLRIICGLTSEDTPSDTPGKAGSLGPPVHPFASRRQRWSVNQSRDA